MNPRKLTARVWLVAGVLLLAGLTIAAGLGPLARALSLISPPEVALIAAIQVVGACACGAAWLTISGGGPLLAYSVARWVRDGVSNLAGLVPATGEFVGARAIMLLAGGDFATGAASTIADTAVEAITQALFTAIGVAWIVGRVSRGDAWGWLGLAGMAAAVVLVLLALTRSQTPYRKLDELVGRIAMRLTSQQVSGRGVGERTRDLLANPRRLAGAASLHLMAWTCGGLQVYAASRAVAPHLGVADCIALEALAHAGRSAFFFVPLGAGVQEGGFLLAGAVFGLSTPEALALSLVLRARDLAFGAPAILAWATTEFRTARSG